MYRSVAVPSYHPYYQKKHRCGMEKLIGVVIGAGGTGAGIGFLLGGVFGAVIGGAVGGLLGGAAVASV